MLQEQAECLVDFGLGNEFSQDMIFEPADHAVFLDHLQLAFEEKTRKILHPNAEPWITYPEYARPTSFDFPIERKVFQEHKRVIVLNLLDHLYGHVLLRLHNAQEDEGAMSLTAV